MAKRPKKRTIYKKREAESKSFYKTKWFFLICIGVLLLIGGLVAYMLYPRDTEDIVFEVLPHSYEIVNTYPHDRLAFTQGLFYYDGYLYESTGLYGQSQLRKVELETGNVVAYHKLDDRQFGEGTEILNGKIYQLTWQSEIGYVYDFESFSLIDSFSYTGEGWGLCTDGDHLIMSDGSDKITFINPYTYEPITQITVSDDIGPVDNINEMEYINGRIFANIFRTYKVAVINPTTGRVDYWIDFEGIISPEKYQGIDVMNGIAYDKENNRIFVTGKNWPYLYEVRIIPPDES